MRKSKLKKAQEVIEKSQVVFATCEWIEKEGMQAIDTLDQYSPFKYHANKARSRSKQKGYITDLTIEYLKEIWDKQNGTCPYTKIQMELGRTSGDEDIKKTPIKASLDRIDPNIGYVRGNVEFVCYCINVMKNDFTKQEMIDFIKLINNN